MIAKGDIIADGVCLREACCRGPASAILAPMIGRVFAAVMVFVCLVLLVRLVLPARQRWRFDTAARRAWSSLRSLGRRTWRWRATRRHAERVADEAIRRAREGDVTREGNVYKPKFRGPRKPH